MWSLINGAIAGLAYWMTAYPFDVMKSKAQNDSISNPKYTRTNEYFTAVYMGNWRNFYRGYSIVLIRALPVNAVGFLAYEIAFSQFKSQ